MNAREKLSRAILIDAHQQHVAAHQRVQQRLLADGLTPRSLRWLDLDPTADRVWRTLEERQKGETKGGFSAPSSAASAASAWAWSRQECPAPGRRS